MIFQINSARHGIFNVIVDDSDWVIISKFKWSINFSNKRNCILTIHRKDKYNNSILLHRVIMNVNDSKIQVDHINGNRLDNRKENLRICTNAQNNRNKVKSKNNTSGYKGIYWHKQIKKWASSITINYKKISLGCYNNKIDAARAYDKAAIKYHREFAKLNFNQGELLGEAPKSQTKRILKG